MTKRTLGKYMKKEKSERPSNDQKRGFFSWISFGEEKQKSESSQKHKKRNLSMEELIWMDEILDDD